MNIVEILQQQCEQSPDATAIIDPAEKQQPAHSFQQLLDDSARTAALLTKHGIVKGDAILILKTMSYELYVILLAIFRVGAVAMFLDPSAGLKHINQCCDINAPKAFIGSGKAHLLRLLSKSLRLIPIKFASNRFIPATISLGTAAEMSLMQSITTVLPEDSALLTFTSGSTGKPKAAERSHGFLVAQHTVIHDALELRAAQVDLTTLPIFLLANLASGVSSVIPDADLRKPGSINVTPIIKQLEHYAVTRSAGSPAFYRCLIEYCEKNNMALDHLQRIDTGGAPVFPSLLQRLHKIAPNAVIMAVYGSTEAEPMCHICFDDINQQDILQMKNGKGLLTGKPVKQAKVCILPDKFGQTIGPFDKATFSDSTLPANQAGEIVVNGNHVLKGYLLGQGDEETKFEVDGSRWHRTGDAGYFDKNGRLWLLGRCTARINDDNGEIYPFTVECAAQFIPGISRTALIEHKGKRTLFIESDKKQGINTLLKTFNWAKLEKIIQLKNIPVDKRHNAKIDYTELHKKLA